MISVRDKAAVFVSVVHLQTAVISLCVDCVCIMGVRVMFHLKASNVSLVPNHFFLPHKYVCLDMLEELHIQKRFAKNNKTYCFHIFKLFKCTQQTVRDQVKQENMARRRLTRHRDKSLDKTRFSVNIL